METRRCIFLDAVAPTDREQRKEHRMTIAGGPIGSNPIAASFGGGEKIVTPAGISVACISPEIAISRERALVPVGLQVSPITPEFTPSRAILLSPLGMYAQPIAPAIAISVDIVVIPVGLSVDVVAPEIGAERARGISPSGLVALTIAPELTLSRARVVTPLGISIEVVTPELSLDGDVSTVPLSMSVATFAPTFALITNRLITPLGITINVVAPFLRLSDNAPEKVVGREPVQIVEIQQPFCALTFGSSPCTASGTADQKCYNTRATCLDPANYDLGSLSLLFSRGNVADRGIEGAPYVIPSLVSVSTSPTRINLSAISRDAQALGNRALCTLVFNDHPHTDRKVDPYLDGRSWDAMGRGSFWSKWITRNKYRQNVLIKVHEGYSGQALSEMKVRSYFLQSVQGPDAQGRITIRGKDVLARIEDRKAQAPSQSNGELFEDISAAETAIEVAGALVSEYDASGTLRIDEEVLTYSAVADSANGITFTVTGRGTDGTSADTHSAAANVQQCLRYADRIDAVVEDLLTTFGGVPAEFIPSAEWAAEAADHLNAYQMSGLITEPTGVTQLISELQAQALFLIWWDERDSEIKFKAIRGINTQPPLIAEATNIMAGSFDLKEEPRERISQAWLYYNQRNPTKSVTDQTNYANAQIIADLDSETDELYGEASIHKIFARFLTQSSLALSTTSKLITRYVDTPNRCVFRMDAKDRGFWTGDQIRIQHHLDVDAFGVERIGTWTITSAREVIPGEVVEYEAEDTTLYGKIVAILADGVGDYVGDGSDAFNGAWIGDSDGLLSNGDNGARIT